MVICYIRYRKDNFGGREVGLELVVFKFGIVLVLFVEFIRKIYFESCIYFCRLFFLLKYFIYF